MSAQRSETWMELSKKALWAGGIGALESMLFFGENFSQQSYIYNYPVPAPVALGLATAGGSLMSDLATNAVLSAIPGDGGKLEKLAVGTAMAAGGTAGALALMDLNSLQTLGQSAVLGATSFLIADQAYAFSSGKPASLTIFGGSY